MLVAIVMGVVVALLLASRRLRRCRRGAGQIAARGCYAGAADRALPSLFARSSDGGRGHQQPSRSDRSASSGAAGRSRAVNSGGSWRSCSCSWSAAGSSSWRRLGGRRDCPTGFGQDRADVGERRGDGADRRGGVCSAVYGASRGDAGANLRAAGREARRLRRRCRAAGPEARSPSAGCRARRGSGKRSTARLKGMKPARR